MSETNNQADPFDLAYSMLQDRDREIRELQAENQSLRSQIVVWKPGGALGAVMPQYIHAQEYYVIDGGMKVHLAMCQYQSAAMDTDELILAHASGWHFRWHDIRWYCLLSDFPLPQPPVTER